MHLLLTFRQVNVRQHSSIDEVFVARELGLLFYEGHFFVFVQTPEHGGILKRYLDYVLAHFALFRNLDIEI